jgi:hypothetical protein
MFEVTGALTRALGNDEFFYLLKFSLASWERPSEAKKLAGFVELVGCYVTEHPTMFIEAGFWVLREDKISSPASGLLHHGSHKKQTPIRSGLVIVSKKMV